MRYIPHTAQDIEAMLQACGLKAVADLFRSIPKNLKLDKNLNLPPALDENSLLQHMEELSKKNTTLPASQSFLGGGVYRHYIPKAVGDIVGRSEFLTPYTPYQPEISQGTLQVIFEFQTMVSEIFGLPIANASVYDGSTGLVEAILMALRIGKKRKTILIPETVSPEYRETVTSILKPIDCNLVSIPFTQTGAIDMAALSDYLNEDLAACVVGYPNFFGVIENLESIVAKVHEAGGLVVTSTPEPLSLGLFATPGEFNVDIATGEGQSLGLSPNFGGPFVGLFATKKEFLRQMPGRLCGMTTDSKGKRGYVLTLSTREQHIRRERATSNICTNQGLCATQMTVFLSLLGKAGFEKLATINWQRAEYAKEKLGKVANVEIAFSGATFNEFVVKTHHPAGIILDKLLSRGWFAGIDLGRWYPKMANAILVNVTELNDVPAIDRYVKDFEAVVKK